MKHIASITLFFASTVAAYAGGAAKLPTVPEINAAAGVGAIAVIGGAVALIWERKRRR